MSAILIMTACWVFTVVLTTLALWFSARVLRYRHTSIGRAVVVTLLWFLVNVGLTVASWKARDSLAAGLFALGMLIAVQCLVIMKVQGTTIARAAAGWGITAVALVLWVVLIVVGVRPWLVQAYRMPVLTMSPTLMCTRQEATCPDCGGTVVFDADDNYLRFSHLTSKREGRCLSCRRIFEATRVPLGQTKTSDRFMVTKFLSPERWDIVALQHEGVTFALRVIALPGEEISIDKEGRLFINGQAATVPTEIPGGRFRWYETAYGTPDLKLNPDQKLQLGADEYFVIGDCSEWARDSRYFGPIHARDIDGVVTWIYWPPSRMRILR